MFGIDHFSKITLPQNLFIYLIIMFENGYFSSINLLKNHFNPLKWSF